MLIGSYSEKRRFILVFAMYCYLAVLGLRSIVIACLSVCIHWAGFFLVGLVGVQCLKAACCYRCCIYRGLCVCLWSTRMCAV